LPTADCVQKLSLTEKSYRTCNQTSILSWERNGTCSILAFIEARGGVHHVSVREYRAELDWAKESGTLLMLCVQM